MFSVSVSLILLPRHYAPHWMRDQTTPRSLSSVVDWQTAFDDLAMMPSFEAKLGKLKSSRWFALNEFIDNTFSEFWGLKMILKHKHKTPIQEEKYEDYKPGNAKSVRKDLAALKSSSGHR